jgi:ferric hydroxamate transport system permease protein
MRADAVVNERRLAGQGLLVLLVTGMTLAAIAMSIHGMLAIGWDWDWDWLPAIWSPDPTNLTEILLHFSFLPRLVISIVAGAMLALAGVLFQQVLRNPLAEPTTLGASSGAHLAMVVAALLWPEQTAASQEFIALAGAACATGLVFALAADNGLSPLTLILAGLIVGLFAGTVTSVLTLFFRESLTSVFVWSSGSLVQNDWNGVLYLAPRLFGALALVALLLRPLDLLALGDEKARSVGLSINVVRLVALLLAVAMSAFVVSSVGVIGFIGLAAPAVVRLAGARTFRQRVLWSSLFGAALLWLADQSAQLINSPTREWPTGILTALLGAPLMLWMLPKLKAGIETTRTTAVDIAARLQRPWLVIALGVVLLILATWVALFCGRTQAGWHWMHSADLSALLPLRAPRVSAALAAGAMLAVSGTLIQRMTGNAMASPEVLGISLGATLGVVLLFFIDPAPVHAAKVAAAAAGAFLTLTLMLSLAKSSAFSPDRMLLTGVAMGTVVGAVLSMLMVSGDPRMSILLAWMAGSTYQVTATDAMAAMFVALVLLIAAPFTARWLELLPLGEVSARELGVDLVRSRLSILLMTAILCAAATLIVGPLSFVGLTAPHIARLTGFQRALPQLAASAVLGALIMVPADWLGRMILFPYQIPAGLMAAAIGAPYFLWLMRHR